ncbi:PIN domain-containing protein [Enteractinococcus helveticum]|uniref:PIN domain-containing protein n=1 Tax=Enteractinococcus helveticum TaxID=1837282 RepID=A0A1B7M0M4_9MICC|nr:hypothetical protein [Enteractinococcus helveticum]OAV61807.1 hypothetical protein A6F49_07890 [Enteractinococcus helveticum]
MTQRVFVDANVLFSKTQMDWFFLLRLENKGMFQLHSTDDVFAEVLANMRKRNPRAPGYMIRRRHELMRRNIDEVLDTFPGNLPFTGKDEHDYHIHAAAIHCASDLVLTNNAPSDSTTGEEPYEIIRPDDFFILVANSASQDMLFAPIKDQIDYWSKKTNQQQLDESLRKAQCPQFAELVREQLRKMARRGL